jgi:hypothetical protein
MAMRVFLGIILGVLLTVAAAYIHDTVIVDERDAAAQPLVNWDVAGRDWHDLRVGIREMGDRIHDQFAKR